MSNPILDSSALPTHSEVAGIPLLPAPEPSRLERRAARASELEYANGGDPNWAAKINKKPRKPRAPKPPKDSKIFKAAKVYLALRAQGMKTPDIAEQLGLDKDTLRQYVYHANKRGWFNIESFADPEDKLEIVLKSKAVRNINTILDETITSEDNGEKILTSRAYEASLEIAKGTGLLKQHQVMKGDTSTPNVFALKVEVINNPMPNGQMQQATPGTFGGTPRYDAPIIDVERSDE